MTSRGMGLPEMEQVGELIAEALGRADDADSLAGIRERVRELCNAFPLYEDLSAA